jgi:uncharacterized membrane protein
VTPSAPVPDRRISMRVAMAAAAILLAGLILVVLIHESLSSPERSPLALVIAVVWTAACAVMSSLGSRHRVGGLLLTAIALAAAAHYWDWLQAHVDLVYLIQHAGSHAVLGIWFGGSLLAARNGSGEAVITRLALRVHGSLPQPIRRYTAQVTGLWTIYFLLMATASVTLFVFGSLQAWSILANLVTMPLIVFVFVAEYLVRLRLHPDFEHVSILAGVRAFMK